MKKPYYNLEQRQYIHLNTSIGDFMQFRLACLNFGRELERTANRSKFLLFIFSVVLSFLRVGKTEPKQTCKNCRFNCEDDHTSMNDCNVGSYYAEKGLNRICYEGELWEGK